MRDVICKRSNPEEENKARDSVVTNKIEFTLNNIKFNSCKSIYSFVHFPSFSLCNLPTPEPMEKTVNNITYFQVT